MCTVTFVPTGPGSYILTSNRDENPQRATEEPGYEVMINEAHAVVFPRDSKAGGSWIAMSRQNRTVCLLNGAFIKHHHQPPYRKSRGLILLEYFDYAGARDFADRIDLDQVEPFTLVIVEDGLYELRWDGQQKHFRPLPAHEAHIWSSCTLYTAEVAEAKEKKFREWHASRKDFRPEEIMHFQGLHNPQGYLLDLEKVKTVSITSIHNTGHSSEMIYHDLLTDKESRKLIEFVGEGQSI